MSELSEKIKAKLTVEQLAIAEKWEVERQQRAELIDQLKAKEISVGEFYDKIDNVHSHCEHGRSIWSHCSSCEEIERIVRPEAFEKEDRELDECFPEIIDEL